MRYAPLPSQSGEGLEVNLRAVLFLALIPAAPLLALGASGEFWGRIYLLWGLTFGAANCVFLGLMLTGDRDGRRAVPSARQLFTRQAIVWCASFAVLGAINLTPLCLGQDNGDGRNSLAMCVLLTVVWSLSMSAFVLPLAYVTSLGVRRAALAVFAREAERGGS